MSDFHIHDAAEVLSNCLYTHHTSHGNTNTTSRKALSSVSVYECVFEDVGLRTKADREGEDGKGCEEHK